MQTHRDLEHSHGVKCNSSKHRSRLRLPTVPSVEHLSVTMVPTIALMGHNGQVGKALLETLVPMHKKTIALVVLHRASSDLSTVPAGVEKRVIDLDKGAEANAAAVRGLDIVLCVKDRLSAVHAGWLMPRSTVGGMAGVRSQFALVDALAVSAPRATLFPSEYGSVFSPDELSRPNLAVFKMKKEVVEYASSKGLGVVVIGTGPFTPYALSP